MQSGGRRGNGRLVETTVMLERDDRAALDEVARKSGRSRSELIREAIRKTWIEDVIAADALEPATRASDPDSDDRRTDWRSRFGALLQNLEQSAATDLSEEELASFVRTEVRARRSAKKQHAGGD